MSKQSMREEAERLIRETMEKRNLVVKQGNTRIEAVCGKCGAPNRLSAERGASRVKFTCSPLQIALHVSGFIASRPTSISLLVLPAPARRVTACRRSVSSRKENGFVM